MSHAPWGAKNFDRNFQEWIVPHVMPRDPNIRMSELPQMTSSHAWLLAALTRFERPLVRYAYSLCSNLETSRDAVQDTFLRLAREREKPDSSLAACEVESAASWLFTVCRNRVIDLHRKSSRLVPMDTELLERAPAPDSASPDGALNDKDTAHRLRKLVAQLLEKQRRVLKLKFETGLSYKEIAAATGLSTGNIGWLIHQAVQSLRTSWQAENA